MQKLPKIEKKPFQLEAFRNRPLIISGPCSAESEEQVITTALELSQTGYTHIFRAGIWKPRTRPGFFEGIGTKGLPWLQQAKALTGMPLAIEVATAKQVEDALHFGIDVLWIGARSTANPFSIQAIADALKGVDIPVLIKNPTNPDMSLWIGALERFEHAGVKQLGLIHRGFSSMNTTTYRNDPMWPIAMEMKSRYPDLMMLNDPSHIAGRREGLQEIIQKATALRYDGFIIESHHDPDKAWSDAMQQIKPEHLKKLLTAIEPNANGHSGCPSIEILKLHMEQLNDELKYIRNKRATINRDLKNYLQKSGTN